jgi:TonB family protein
LTSAAVALLLVPVASVRSVAQSSATGAISGTVSDISGKRVPNAVVLVKSVDSSKMEVTGSDAAGEFEFKSLPAGKYTLEVRSKGFKTYNSKELILTGGAAVRNSAVLELGTVSETIDVVATSPMAKAKENEPKRIPVGGNVQATKLTKMVRPVYPETAKAAGIEGSVLMKAVISREGDLISLEVLNSLVDPELAKAAKDAVSQWKYAPTMLNGEPVEVITTITVNFKLSAN